MKLRMCAHIQTTLNPLHSCRNLCYEGRLALTILILLECLCRVADGVAEISGTTQCFRFLLIG